MVWNVGINYQHAFGSICSDLFHVPNTRSLPQSFQLGQRYKYRRISSPFYVVFPSFTNIFSLILENFARVIDEKIGLTLKRVHVHNKSDQQIAII